MQTIEGSGQIPEVAWFCVEKLDAQASGFLFRDTSVQRMSEIWTSPDLGQLVCLLFTERLKSGRTIVWTLDA